MADVITRFKLETTQYDSKLRDASKGLAEYTRQATMAGNEFGKFTQKNVEAARALGSITPSATNAKDKVKELVGAFNDAAKAYNSLTKEQQQSDFGKAMASSLQQLQGRIKETKNELYSLGDATKNAGSSLFGENGLTGMLQVAGGNLLAQGVSMLAGELKDTVQQSIELAKSGEGVRLAFERLNRPGLLDNLKEATHGTVSELELMKAAVKFDDFKLPVEQLGTLLAFAQKKAKDTGQSVDYMVDSIVTGLGRKSLMILDNLGLSAAQIKEKMKESGDMTKAVAEIIKEQMAEAGEYVETASDRAAKAAADASNEMMKLGEKAIPVAEAWSQTWNTLKVEGMDFLTTVLGPIAESIKYINGLLAGTPEDIFTKNWKNGQVGSNVDDNGNYIKRPAQKGAAGFDWENGTWKTGYSGAIYNSATGQTELPEVFVTGTKPTTPKKKTKGGSKKTTISDTDKQSNYWAKANANANIFAESFKPEDVLGPSEAWEKYKGVITNCSDSIADFSSETSKWTKNFNPVAEYLEKDAKLAKQQQMAFDAAAQSAINLGSALASIDDPGAKAAGTVIGAIANIALGFGQAVAQAGTMGPWAWLAYVAAGTAALATTISTVHSLTGYAQGGIVKGNSYSGDNVPALVDGSQMVGLNAGEVVLTAAQTNNLAAGIQNGGSRIQVVGKLSGEQLFICAERWAKRTGKGEFVTWR